MLSLRAASNNISAEIIVVDNNSSDESCFMIEENFPEVSLIKNKSNLGFSRANNLGVSKAKGEYVLILNPDTILAEDVLEKTLNFSEETKNIGALGLRFIDGHGNFLPESKRNCPTVGIAIKKIVGQSSLYYANQISEDEISKVDILTGAFMLMKRAVYIEMNGFDEAYFMYGEDVDLSYRLVKQGYENYYFGKSTIIHFKGESTTRNMKYLKDFYGAMRIFYKKHFKRFGLGLFFLNAFSRVTMLVNSVFSDTVSQRKWNGSTFFYLGDDLVVYNKIKHVLNSSKSEISTSVPMDLSLFEAIIIDSKYRNYKEIIDIFEMKETQGLMKRIIPLNRSFMIGSDSAKDKGEVQSLE